MRCTQAPDTELKRVLAIRIGAALRKGKGIRMALGREWGLGVALELASGIWPCRSGRGQYG